MYSNTQLFLIHSGLFFAGAVFSLLINSLFLRFAHTLGIRDHKQLVRWSSTAKPAFGGIGFFIIFLGSFSVYSTLFPKLSDPLQPGLLGLLAATGLGFLMGLADDAYNTRPLLKFGAQIACGAILIASGSGIRIFGDPWMDHALTILWVVGMMNSINMLDNMDAITTVTSLAILGCVLTVHLLMGDVSSVHMVIVIGVMAALAGFLFFNWSPSRMYMGDTGSQFLGVFLAYVGIRYFWNSTSPWGDAEPWRQAAVTLVVFLLPIADTTTVTVNRMLKGRSPFVGGRDHTTHHLGYAGLSDAQVAFVYAGLGLLNVFMVFCSVKFIGSWRNLHTIIYVAYSISIAGALFVLTRSSRPAEPRS